LGIKKEKIRLIYSGLSDKFKIVDRNDDNLIRVKEKYSLPYKFILYLGTMEPRKNISAVISAYSRLQKEAAKQKDEELQKYKLVIAGSDGWLNKNFFTGIEKSKYRKNIIFTGFIHEEDKEYVFNLATLFVYPSFFEGFGFPPLEAMACGVPTITSNGSSFPETIGLGAVMIDADKPSEIYCIMKEILKKKEFREKLIKNGLAQAKIFTWKKSATGFLKMINKM
jgi:glycosyltransferase involved in cell wall biosynthesis